VTPSLLSLIIKSCFKICCPSADILCGPPHSYSHTALTYFEFKLKVHFYTQPALVTHPQASENRLAAPPSAAALPVVTRRQYSRPKSSIFSYFNYRLLLIIKYMTGILNYADKIAVFNFFRLIVWYVDSSCQWSVAVVKAVAELKIDHLWLQHTARLAGSHVTTV